ncbi:MAG: type I DNA topoisomerase [Victivallaceae bacterium]|nr:type I DNA topoisomerase [Victivallaceae bacterium]
MSKKLLIVESPTKARTITRMLGTDYKIMASMGHVRDLPERSFGVDIQHDFAPIYTDTPRSRKVVADLKSAVKRAGEVYLAPDPDREGEAIAWHLSELLKEDFKKDFKRVTFHEVTKQAIERALEHPGSINMALVDSQQARRVLDRIVGYQVSPLLWSRITRGISAGRVQSVALRLVVERERQILAFESEEYWNISAMMKADSGAEFAAKLVKINGSDTELHNEADAAAAVTDLLDNTPFVIEAVSTSKRQRTAPPPFTTSTMQQFANSALHFSASATMRYAQQLYEGVNLGQSEAVGLITYMRTDSVNIAREAQLSALDFIAATYGAEYRPAKPNFFRSKGLAQEAHEAIRPTDVRRTPESLSGVLDSAQLKLYTLIWNRFVASQMSPARIKALAVDTVKTAASGKTYLLRSNAQVTEFPGFLAVFPEKNKEESIENMRLLSSLEKNSGCAVKSVDPEQKFTEPPPRYTEATLIKELEENGIGRPSTYATILKTIQARAYVVREKNALVPSELGFQVNDLLVEALPELFQVAFTRKMEGELDEIEAGKIRWTKMLHSFYNQFQPWLENAKAAGAADANESVRMLDLLGGVKWNEPVKVGRKVYDDRKFFDSIAQKYAANSRLSQKQFVSLVELAAKYRDQLPGAEDVVKDLGAEAEFNAACDKVIALRERAAAAATTGDPERYRDIFKAFDQVKWEAPTARRGRSFDDRKFFLSLEEQAESGRTLSDKQLGVLRKLAMKYRQNIADFDALSAKLNLGAEEKEPAAPAEQTGGDDGVRALLDKFAKVANWAEPVRRGRRVYDDQAFYKSLADQFANGKNLSEKQVAALRKLATKYEL